MIITSQGKLIRIEAEQKKRLTTTQFLNRILGLDAVTQKLIFQLFIDVLHKLIKKAKRDGTFEHGVQTYEGQHVVPREEPQVLFSGGTLYIQRMDRDRGAHNPYCVPAQMTVPTIAKWLLVFEDPLDGTITLGQGVPRVWLHDGKEVGVERGPTRWGPVRRVGGRACARLWVRARVSTMASEGQREPRRRGRR